MSLINPIHSCLALYGNSNSTYDFEGWYYWINKVLLELKFTPVGIAATAPGFTDGKVISASHASRRLIASKFASVTTLEMFFSLGVGHYKQFNDAEAILSSSPTSSMLGFLSVNDGQNIVGNSTLVDWSRKFYQYFNYGYGYAFRRAPEDGPVVYAMGGRLINYSKPITQQEEQKELLWFRDSMDRRTFLTKRLRDIYEVNIINESHLRQLISNLTLGDWIQAEPWRGTLHAVVAGIWAWIVSPNDVNRVSTELAKSDLLICH